MRTVTCEACQAEVLFVQTRGQDSATILIDAAAGEPIVDPDGDLITLMLAEGERLPKHRVAMVEQGVAGERPMFEDPRPRVRTHVCKPTTSKEKR